MDETFRVTRSLSQLLHHPPKIMTLLSLISYNIAADSLPLGLNGLAFPSVSS